MNTRNLLAIPLAACFGAALLGCGSGDATDTADAGKPDILKNTPPPDSKGSVPNAGQKGGLMPPGP